MGKIYDIAVLGAGVAGVMATYRLLQNGAKDICLIEFGRPPGKRRKQLEGWFGCFPYSNARLYFENDYQKVKKISGIKKLKPVFDDVIDLMSEHGSLEKIKTKIPNKNIIDKIKKTNSILSIDEYCQWKPENIHSLSRRIAENVENSSDVDTVFDTEVNEIDEKNGVFVLTTEHGEMRAKRLLLCFGRSGWRFAKDFFNKLGLSKNDDLSTFGFRAELSTSYMKDWNKSHCTIVHDDMKIGPLSWNGTIIPEDHNDFVISSWRSNEDRWKTEKVAFSVMISKKFKGMGLSQTERLGKLAFVLADNRVGKGRLKDYLNGNFDISIVPEYDWIKANIGYLNKIFPLFSEKAYFHVPDIHTDIPKIKLGNNFDTENENLFVAGENAGVSGLISAMTSGFIAADGLSK